MVIKEFHNLCDDAMKIRQKVFVEEQKFQDEFDEIDQRCITLVGYIDDQPVACSRAFFDEEEKKYKVGRFAVLKDYRKKGLGLEMLKNNMPGHQKNRWQGSLASFSASG